MRKQYRPDYYEAVIQIRPNDEKVFAFIRNDINKRNDVFISNAIEKKYGLDIYVSSQRYVRSLAKRLKQQFKGELKLTYTLHTEDRQTSRKLHRATLLFRLLEEPSLTSE